ncbi:hypothetical protein C7974DRAFT_450330 [Boeremia exigua]|uniref:uncharacterized protein n=1 Tax=Boeremia exigua TaxID=749465 RepID=UPI001E8CE8A7|nr:uncharacterized protein C7974DRAFT_450330 [Boeremia exigua]KAH6637430.1 hypothetical protein C7974DRAFT_450330 [Boeremia exigua]
MTTTLVNKNLSLRTPAPHKHRQSQLYRDLERLLDLTPSTFSSPLLSLPAPLRAQIFALLLPPATPPADLHTCLWNAEMLASEPWRHASVGYAPRVPAAHRVPPALLLINKSTRAEVLGLYWARANLTLHAELRNTKFQNELFVYSPHLLRLPLRPHVKRARLYVEWNFTLTRTATPAQRRAEYEGMARDLCKAVDEVLGACTALASMEVSVLFFWKWRSGRVYELSMGDLFEVEEVVKRVAEPRWLALVAGGAAASEADGAAEGAAVRGDGNAAAVGYKLSSENKGVEQSGGMEIYVSPHLERCMGKRRREVDFYGVFAVNETLPQPQFDAGRMI